MSCSQFDLKAYFLEELDRAARPALEDHLRHCAACREELERLNATRATLFALREEELPRRIAFVSDKVFEPSWWQRLWASGPRLGFASAALLSVAILVHALLRPVPAPVAMRTPAPVVDTAAMEARISEEVAKRLQPAIDRAVALGEERQAHRTTEAVAATRKQFEMYQAADRMAVAEAFMNLDKRLKVQGYYAASNFGGRP
jgi:hypothetical protein